MLDVNVIAQIAHALFGYAYVITCAVISASRDDCKCATWPLSPPAFAAYFVLGVGLKEWVFDIAYEEDSGYTGESIDATFYFTGATVGLFVVCFYTRWRRSVAHAYAGINV